MRKTSHQFSMTGTWSPHQCGKQKWEALAGLVQQHANYFTKMQRKVLLQISDQLTTYWNGQTNGAWEGKISWLIDIRQKWASSNVLLETWRVITCIPREKIHFTGRRMSRTKIRINLSNRIIKRQLTKQAWVQEITSQPLFDQSINEV